MNVKLKTLISSKKDLLLVPIYKAANNVVFNCKYLYVLTIIRELNLDCQTPCHADNSTEAFIKTKLKFK